MPRGARGAALAPPAPSSIPGPEGALALAADVRAGARSAREECERRLALAAEQERLGAFWTLTPGRARAGAEAVDRTVARGGDPGPLAGVPVAWKDCIDVAGAPSGAGIPGEHPDAPADAVVVARAHAAGALELGKLAMHQLAWGMSGQCPGRPLCRNPHDPERIPGGSSSGSAVAVAAGIVDLAGGTDAGGSVRAPAALCGVVGVMPSYGRLPRDGVLPLCPTLENVGALARTVADCAAMLDAMEGAAPRAYAAAPLAGLRIGVLERGFCESLDSGVEMAFRAALEGLARAGARLIEVDVGWHEDPDVLRAIFDCEPLPVVAELVGADPGAFGDDIRGDVERGLGVGALEYLRARERLGERRRRAAEALALADVFASPTIPLEAPALDGPDLTRTLNRNTKPFNGLRWPALSLPCGLDGASLPVGMQLASGPGRDRELLRAALAVEACLAAGGAGGPAR